MTRIIFSLLILMTVSAFTHDRNVNHDPYANESFTIDDSKSKFKLCKSADRQFRYTIGEKDCNLIKNEPTISISIFPALKDSNITLKNHSEFILSALKQYGLEDIQVKNTANIDLHGHNAYEVEAYGIQNKEKKLVYLLITQGNGKVYTIQGTTPINLEKNLTDFRTLAMTLKLK